MPLHAFPEKPYDELRPLRSELRLRHLIILSEARVGQSGVVERIDLDEDVSHHLAHLGFLPGAGVEVLRRAPAGDPTVYRIDGVEVGLRNETAKHIRIELNSLPPEAAR